MKNLTSSVDKTFAILDYFTDQNHEWGITELSRKMDSNKSTVYRFLSDLEKIGAMYRNPKTGKYGLGLKLFELGKRVRLQSAFVDKTHAALMKVAERINETVHVGILKENKVYYVDKIKAPQGLTIDTEIGSCKPLHATSLGKVLLAFSFSNGELMDNNILQPELIPYTKNTHVSLEALLTELDGIRKQGYAIDREEFEIGLICVGVPIFNKNNDIVGSLSAAGPASRFEEKEVAGYVESLRSGAILMKENIGTFKL